MTIITPEKAKEYSDGYLRGEINEFCRLEIERLNKELGFYFYSSRHKLQLPINLIEFLHKLHYCDIADNLIKEILDKIIAPFNENGWKVWYSVPKGGIVPLYYVSFEIQ